MKQQRFTSCLSSHYKLFYSGTGSDTVLKQTIMHARNTHSGQG
jgi:hypothetical protein